MKQILVRGYSLLQLHNPSTTPSTWLSPMSWAWSVIQASGPDNRIPGAVEGNGTGFASSSDLTQL